MPLINNILFSIFSMGIKFVIWILDLICHWKFVICHFRLLFLHHHQPAEAVPLPGAANINCPTMIAPAPIVFNLDFGWILHCPTPLTVVQLLADIMPLLALAFKSPIY